jgi:hypothetical protein
MEMTISLDSTVVIGDVKVAVLTRRKVTVTTASKSFLITAAKSPVAFILRDGTSMTALAPDGTRLTKDMVNALCGGAWQTVLESDA